MVFELECQQKMVEKSSTPDERREGKGLPYKNLRSASFDKSERLFLKSDFSAVFNAPSGRFTTNGLRMLYRENDLELSRIGIIIPKRFVKLASARNRYKRLIREQFRRVKKSLPNADIVLFLNKNVSEKELIIGCDRTWEFLTFENDG